MKRAAPAVWSLESVLLFGIRGGIVLLLLTPFVISPGTVYPFIVGKALYSRALIEVVFGLWLLLASMNPAFRPPRSWLLILMAAGLAWAAVAAGFGVSPQRSLWSNYERMAGLVDAAHWFALVVVAHPYCAAGASCVCCSASILPQARWWHCSPSPATSKSIPSCTA